MSVGRVPSLLAAFLLAAGAFAAGLVVATPAAAEPTRVAECKYDFEGMGFSPKTYTAAVSAWMTEQLAAGRTQFTALSVTSQVSMMCAW